MIPRGDSLLGRLVRSLILPGVLAIFLGALIVYDLFKEEYDELLDMGLTSKAHLLLQIAEGSGEDPNISDLLGFQNAALAPEERAMFWFMNGAGQIIGQSAMAGDPILPGDAAEGIRTLEDKRVVVLRSASRPGLSVIVAEPMQERNEAVLDVVLGALVGFILLGLLFYLVAYLAIARSSRIIAKLSENIAQKSEQDLSPIDRRNSFAEIEPAIDTLDKLLGRLDTVLAAERAFATNAAHELRTPVAISLAHVQRLKSKLADPTLARSAAEIEEGLKRLVRLTERLLQMSRAQSGLGLNATATDINPVVALLLRELRQREPSKERLIILAPVGQWFSRIDPDALGIILNNLFDNAFKHASGGGAIFVDAHQPGGLTVSNDCDALTQTDLDKIKTRFVRKATLSDGYGLGLSIVQELCRQSGCVFEVISPQPGASRGFTAMLTFPGDPEKA